MRHRKSGRKFGMSSSHRKAMLRNLLDSLIVNARIETTVTRAKELRILAERMITLAKAGSLASKRRALRFIRTKDAFVRLFGEYAEKFKERNGGYTRIIKTRLRSGDNAQLAYIEYILDDIETKKATKKRRRARKKSTNENTQQAVDNVSATGSEDTRPVQE